MELLFAFVLGSVIGSFLNVVILRIPKDESIVYPSSHCFACGNSLKPWHNIPIISWLFLRGKCAFCNSKISMQYPAIELLSGIIFVLLISKFGISIPIFFVALSFLMLLALSMIDFRYKMVPDSINLLAIVFAVFGAWSIGGIFINLKNAMLFAGGFTLLRFTLSYLLTSSAHREAKKNHNTMDKKLSYIPFYRSDGGR